MLCHTTHFEKHSIDETKIYLYEIVMEESVDDSNCELISEIDIVEHKLEPISGEDNDTDIEQENDNDKDSDAPSQQNDHDNDIEQEIVDADFILTNVPFLYLGLFFLNLERYFSFSDAT